MGHKIHPRSYRIGTGLTWKSRYFKRKDLPLALEEDMIIRETIKKKLAKMGIESIEVERSNENIQIVIKSARPGLIIGRGGTGIEDLRKTLARAIDKFRRKKRRTEKISLQISVEEVKKPEISAQVVAENITADIEKRTPFRRIMKQYLARILQHKEVGGAKIMLSGRLDGAEISRTEWLAEGKIPLVTIRSDIDYGEAEAYNTYGVVGVKVWIYKGEQLS
jgi:small subunit ribosomal protein S3